MSKSKSNSETMSESSSLNEPRQSEAAGLPREEKIRRWGNALTKAGLWFGAALLVTAYFREGLTAHPIIVHTNSIDTGVYWLDLRPNVLQRGQTITFEFKPSTSELAANFPATRHTKILWGLPGDIVKADKNGTLKICEPTVAQQHGVLGIGEVVPKCADAGSPRAYDSQGRPLYPWLKVGQTYTLGVSEYWVYAPNPKSLDSRYNGPVLRDRILGVAKPLLIWGSWKD